nr:2-C-methyl-D-erythritol 4-phosphate cytidylyltransferase [Bifidobacterium felsineum]
MVDIDNTLADYTDALRDYIHETMDPDDYPCPDPVEYDMTLTDGWPFTGRPADYRWWHKRAVADGLYSKEQPYPHAVDTLKRLHDDGWWILIATSRRDDMRGDTIRWLNNNRIPHDGLYMGDKTLIQASVTLEDNPTTIRRLTDLGRYVIHPDHKYCRDEKYDSYHDWNQLPNLLEEEL